MATNTQTREEREAVKAAALDYLDAGLSVLRIGHNKKPSIPDTEGHKWEELQDIRATPERLEAWYRAAEREGLPAAVGILGGRISGNLWILDFDIDAAEIYPAWLAYIADTYPELATALEGAPVARTGKGYHVYVRLPEPRPNEKLATVLVEENGKRKLAAYIETRGEGGYVVAPPSPHPSGRLYQWERPLNGDIPKLSPEQVEQLVAASRIFDKREAYEPEERPERPLPDIRHETRPQGDIPTREDLREMLGYISYPTSYEEWVAVLMAIHSVYPGPEGVAIAVEWREWEPGEIAQKWRGFKPGGGIGIGTLVDMAKRGGYKPRRREPSMPSGPELAPSPPLAAVTPERLPELPAYVEELVLVDTPQAAAALNAAGLSIRAAGLTGDRLSKEQVAGLQSAGVRRVLVATSPELREATLRALFRAKHIEGLLVATWPGESGLEQLGPAAAEEAINGATRAGAWLAEHITAGIEGPLSDLEEERILGRAVELWAWLEDREPLQAEALLVELCERLDITYTEIRPRLERAGELRAQAETREAVETLLHAAATANEAGDMGRARENTEAASRAMSSVYVERPRAYTLADLEADLLHEPESIPLPWEELAAVKFPRAGLSIISAKSGGGKTTMMLNLFTQMLHYPSLAEDSLYFFTYEEPASHIGLKVLMLLSGVELNAMQNFDAFRSYMRRRSTAEPFPLKPEEEWKREKIEAALQSYDRLTASGRLVIDDKMPRLDDLTATLELIAQRGTAAAVFVDYVQRIPAPRDYKVATRQLELAHTVQELRATAVQNGLAIITGSQVNDQGELREARDIYHEAQVVLKLETDIALGLDTLRVAIDKQRSGVSNISALLNWHLPTLRISKRSGGAAARSVIIEE